MRNNMRKLWTQREVIEMAKILGFKNFDRRSLAYWEKQGIFPQPHAQLKNVLVLYENDFVEVGLVDISRRLREPLQVTYEDVKWAKGEVLKSNKAKNVSILLRKIKGDNKSNGEH
jgi:hypothetical protein